MVGSDVAFWTLSSLLQGMCAVIGLFAVFYVFFRRSMEDLFSRLLKRRSFFRLSLGLEPDKFDFEEFVLSPEHIDEEALKRFVPDPDWLKVKPPTDFLTFLTEKDRTDVLRAALKSVEERALRLLVEQRRMNEGLFVVMCFFVLGVIFSLIGLLTVSGNGLEDIVFALGIFWTVGCMFVVSAVLVLTAKRDRDRVQDSMQDFPKQA